MKGPSIKPNKIKTKTPVIEKIDSPTINKKSKGLGAAPKIDDTESTTLDNNLTTTNDNEKCLIPIYCNKGTQREINVYAKEFRLSNSQVFLDGFKIHQARTANKEQIDVLAMSEFDKETDNKKTVVQVTSNEGTRHKIAVYAAELDKAVSTVLLESYRLHRALKKGN